MRLRWSITISVILLAVIFIFVGHGDRVKRGNVSYWIVDRIELGDGRSVLILTNDEPFEISAWFYEIHVNGKTIVPTTYMFGCYPDGEGEFEVVSSRDDNVVGLIWTKRPGVIAIAHDFASGASWPRGEDPSDWKIGLRPGGGLLEILQADNPQTKLRF